MKYRTTTGYYFAIMRDKDAERSCHRGAKKGALHGHSQWLLFGDSVRSMGGVRRLANRLTHLQAVLANKGATLDIIAEQVEP